MGYMKTIKKLSIKDKDSELSRIKKNIERAFNYFKDNYKTFHSFRRFTFVSTLDDADLNLLKALKKPMLEFNTTEAYVSRLLGEFSKQEPSLELYAEDSSKPDPLQVDIVEGLFRHLLDETERNGHSYEVYRDLISGGFSVFKVMTEYANEKSFDQVIKLKRVSDPTLCGFDPTAKLKGKQDGRFCVEIFPLTKEEAASYDIDTSDIKFSSSDAIGNFNWSYKNQDEDILIVADYYEKVIEDQEIVMLSDGTVSTKEEYNEVYNKFKKVIKETDSEESINVENYLPTINDSRTSTTTKIYRTRLVQNKIIEKIETDYLSLPLIFADGNSITYREGESGDYKQFTRPLVYHIRGIQKLKNFAGQTLANELENMVQHKFKVAKESIPAGYEEAYRNVQQASLLVFNAFKDNDPNVPLPPPMEIGRIPAPPEVTNTFMIADQTMQNILGSYDSALGINDNQLSGVAIKSAAAHSNATAMPYITGYLQALSDAAQTILELIPLYYKTNRTIPVITNDGKREFIKINDEELGGIHLNYDASALKVRVKAGLNFDLQKSNTIKYIVELSNAMPVLSEFFNTKALPVIVDNLNEMRGGDKLKGLVEEFLQEKKQAANAEKPQDPIMMGLEIEQEKLKQKDQQNKSEIAIKAAELELQSYGRETDRMKLALEEEKIHHSKNLDIDKHHSEKARTMAELAIKSADLVHKHKKDYL